MNPQSNFDGTKDQEDEQKQEQTIPYPQDTTSTFIKAENHEDLLESSMSQQIYTQQHPQSRFSFQNRFQVDLSRQPYPQFQYQRQQPSNERGYQSQPQFGPSLVVPPSDSPLRPANEEIAVGSSSHSRKRPRKADHGKPGDEGDTELKQLAFKASKYPLKDLALQIRTGENDDTIPEFSISDVSASGKETGKERQRQIFAMVWLLNSCESSPTAVVPRNRIYARYVQICADNSLTPLSPASFGKLVRILFPSLTTRRLGMRGQSKYHYCGIKLVGDQNVQGGSPSSESPPSLHTRTPSIPHVNDPRLVHPINSTRIAETFHLHDIKCIPNLFQLVETSLNNEDMNSPLNLPSIYPYLPKSADYDIADTLYSLYKVHCTSIFESLRYMHIGKLFSSFTTFNSILTAPVFKLYTSEPVMEWVRECDLVMYRSMAKMLTKLHLQNVPDEVVQNLEQVSRQYTYKLQNSLQYKVPKSFRSMKLKTAKHFISILTRLVKVIETGQSAARILANNNEKQAMLEDWRQLDIREITLREVPCRLKNLELVIRILTTDVNSILERDDSPSSKDFSTLVQLARLVSSLPGHFRNSNPRLFMLVSSNLLTTFLREISLNRGQSFGAWWIVRCWVDEFIYWCFELGGFLQEEFQLENFEIYPPDSQANYEDTSGDHLRSSSMVDLLEGALFDSKDVSNDFSYDTTGLENILGKNDLT